MKVLFRGVVAVLVLLAALGGAGVSSAVGGQPPPTPAMSEACLNQPFSGVFAWYVDFANGWEYWRAANCPRDFDPQLKLTATVWIVSDHDAGEAYPVEWCLEPGQVADLGVKGRFPDNYAQNGTIHNLSGRFVEVCSGVSDPVPPLVNVSGTVELDPATATEHPGGLAGARYELWARVRGGDNAGDNPNAEPEWTHLRGGPANSGEHETGYLDGEGGFDFDFYYPAPFYQYGNWQMFYGCPWPNAPEFFVHGDPPRATPSCLASDIQLRVYADNADETISVTEDNQPALIATINLGDFHRHPDTVYDTDATAAHAWAAATAAVDYTAALGNSVGPVDIALTDSGDSGYDPTSRTIRLRHADSASGDPEFHIATQWLHDTLGESYPGLPADCTAANLTEPTSDNCAFVHGAAAYLANQIETPTDPAQEPLISLGGSTIDLEHCTHGAAVPCADGPSVAGRVAAAFTDLTDPANETSNGFTDDVTIPTTHPNSVPAVIAEHTPATAEEFYDGWRAHHAPSHRLVMFMNTLEYADLQDEERAAVAAGAPWTTIPCATCRDGDLRTVQPATTVNKLRWDLSAPSGRDTFDIWVRLPAGHAGLEPNAVFTVIDGGAPQVVVNQATAADGWVSLRPQGFLLEPNAVLPLTLQAPNATGTLVADAVIIAPHDGDPPPATVRPVDVTGKVKTRVSAAMLARRDLGGARYELLYKGRDGGENSPVGWRPVLDSVGPNGQPAGNPVTGHLGADGSYDLSFVYPNTYQLNDGTWWHGCVAPAEPIDFQGGAACANGELILKVYSVNEDESSRVELDGPLSKLGVAAEVPLGEFFIRPPGQTDYLAVTEEAYAYGGILTVRELVGDELGEVLIEIKEDPNPKARSHYDPVTETINLVRRHAWFGTPEHEVGHALQHQLSGFWLPNLHCQDHEFHIVTNEECAFQEGFANFISTAAEYRYAVAGSEPMFHGVYPLENCSNATCVNSGEAVEGRVAMGLWDLYDGTADSRNTLTDRTPGHPIGDLLDVLRDADAETFEEFWALWRERYDGDLETMLLNTLLTTVWSDAGDSLTTPKGTWIERVCTTPCVNDSILHSTGTASLTWNVDPLIKDDGRYDIWVHIPQWGPPIDNAAAYTVQTENGPVTVTVNQRTNSGWVNLRKEGFAFDTWDDTKIVLRPGPNSAAVVADGLIVMPHQD